MSGSANHKLRSGRALSLALVAVVSVGISLSVFLNLQSAANESLRLEFQGETSRRARIVEDLARRHLAEVDALAAFFNASDSVTKEEFSTFCRPLLRYRAGIRTFAWAPLVLDSERRVFEEQIRERIPGFAIRDSDNAGTAVPEHARDRYIPITYLEPQGDYASALGFDLAARVECASVLSEASESGEIQVSERTHFVSGAPEDVSVLIVRAVFSREADVVSAGDRSASLVGYAVAVLNPRVILDLSVTESAPAGIDNELVDYSAEAGIESIYSRPSRLTGTALSPFRYNFDASEFVHDHRFEFGGREWGVIYSAVPAYGNTRGSLVHWLVWPISAVITALLMMYVNALYARREFALRMVDEKTAELRKSEQRWQFALDGSRDGVWDRDLSTNRVILSPQALALLQIEAGHPPMTYDEWRRIIPSAEFERIEDELERHIRGETPYFEMEHPIIRGDGSRGWFMSRGKVMERSSDGRPLRLVGTYRDITDRREEQQALEESERRLSTLIAHFPGIVYRCRRDRYWTMEFISDGCLELTGYRPLEFLDNGPITFESLVFKDERTLVRESVDAALRESRPYEIQYRIRDANGAVKWVWERGSRTRVGPDGTEYLEGFIWDVTSRVRAEQELQLHRNRLEELVAARTAELQQSEVKTRTILDTVVDGIITTDDQGTIRTANPSAARMFGYAPEEIVGLNVVLLMPETQMATYVNALRKVVGSGEDLIPAKDVEGEGKRKDGSTFPLELAIAESIIGEERTFIGVTRDISERKMAERAIQQERDRAQKYLDTVGVMLLVVDVDGEIQLLNRKGCEILGYTEREALGKNWFDTCIPHAERESVRSYFAELIAGHTSDFDVHENSVVTRNGEHRLIGWKNTMLRDEQGAISGVLSSGDDITELTRMVEALERAKVAAEAANQAKSTFLANMSHEIRTPLNAVLGYTQLLQRGGELNSEQCEYLGIIARSGEHLLGLINDVLEMSKIEAGRVTYNPEFFELFALLDEIESMFRLRVRERNLRLTFDTRLSGPVPLIGDRGKIRQVLLNLLSNAVKFTDSGGVTVRVQASGGAEPTFQIEVEDSGCGIPPDDISAIFESFGQTDTGRNRGGTGLGLPISRHFARILGGDLTVMSTLGAGSVFRFTFKAKLAEGPIDFDTNRPLERKAVAISHPTSEIKILVVDDNEPNRDVLRRLLESVGFSVKEASSGEQALSEFESWIPHAVLMDRRMPGMDGAEATRILKATDKGRNIPIIMVTASALEEHMQEARDAGADSLIRKPFHVDEILTELGRLLSIEYLWEEVFSNQEIATDEYVGEEFERIPESFLSELADAAESGDVIRIRNLVGDGTLDAFPRFRAKLSGFVRSYRYDQVLELLKREIRDGDSV